MLKEKKLPVFDMSAYSYDENDDYPDVAFAVGKKVSEAPEDRVGILICGSGAGVDIVANKLKGVRSVLAISAEQAVMARADDYTNILSIAADITDESSAKQIFLRWIDTAFSTEERHLRRLKKIAEIESEVCK